MAVLLPVYLLVAEKRRGEVKREREGEGREGQGGAKMSRDETCRRRVWIPSIHHPHLRSLFFCG